MGEFAAFSTIVLVGYISAPPTIGSFICAETVPAVIARAITAIPNIVFFIRFVLYSETLVFGFVTALYSNHAQKHQSD
jgi:hypothetical protein